MKTFKLYGLDQWSPVAIGEKLVFVVPGKGRHIKLTVNTSSHVEVYGSYTEDMSNAVLLGAADGLFHLDFHANKRCFLEVRSSFDADVFVCGTSADHSVAATDEEKYTSVVPHGRRNTEFDRMMLLMRHNEKRRDQMLAREIERLQASQTPAEPAEPVIEPTPTERTPENENRRESSATAPTPSA